MAESGWQNGKYVRSTFFLENLKGSSITQLFANDSSFFTSTNLASNSISVIDRATKKLKISMPNEGVVNAFALVQSDNKIVGASNKQVKVWDVEKGETLCSMEGHTGDISCLFATDNAAITASDTDEFINIWDLRKQQNSKNLYPAGTGVLFVQAAGAYVVVAFVHSIHIWDLQKGKKLHQFAVGGCVRALSISSDKQFIIIGSTDKNGFGIVTIYSFKDLQKEFKIIRTLTENGKQFDGVFNVYMDDVKLICGGLDSSKRDSGTIHVFDPTRDFKLLYSLKEPHGAYSQCMHVTNSEIVTLEALKGGAPSKSGTIVTYKF